MSRSRIVNEWWGLTSAGIWTFLTGVACGVGLCLYAGHDKPLPPQAGYVASDASVSPEGAQFLNAWCEKNYRGNTNVR